jgi:hypothetical protein
MAKKTAEPQRPVAPDPYAVAQAQGQANTQTAIANTTLGNADVLTPYGSSTFRQIGEVNGVPRWQQTVALSPEEQRKKDQQDQLQYGLNDMALDQQRRVAAHLSQPLLGGAIQPERVNQLGPLPSLQGYDFQQLQGGAPLQTNLGNTDFEGARKSVEDAIYARLNPQLERDRASLESTLVNQGFARGSEAFNREMDSFGRQANDARLQAVAAGGQEQSRLFDIARGLGQFANAAQQQAFDQASAVTGTNNDYAARSVDRSNANAMGLYGLGADAAAFQNNARQAALQEALALRNQPINEISTLMGGGQVQMPQFTPFKGGSISDTPLAQSVYQSADLQQKQYAADRAARAQELAGLYGLAGSLGGAATRYAFGGR